MNGGVVTGGWNFVIAAYGITVAILLIYGVSLMTRLREENERRDAESDRH